MSSGTATPSWNPDPLSEPPPHLNDWKLPTIEVRGALFQCHGRKRGPLNFNPISSGRFNAPNAEYGTTYVSVAHQGAFAEKFLQQVIRNPEGRIILDTMTFDLHCLCMITVLSNHHLRLVNLTGEGSVNIGADIRLSTATDNPGLIQRWGLALWQHPETVDGIYYLARHDSEHPSIAVFDRAKHLVSADCSVDILQDKIKLDELKERYRIAFIR